MRKAVFLNWTVLIVAVVLLLSHPATAEFMQDVHGDRIHPGAEEYYGVIDDMPEQLEAGGQVIIINDSVYRIDDGVMFRSVTGGLADLSFFTPGMMVHYYALGNLLTKMWPTGEMHETAPPSAEFGEDEEAFRFEDGLWRN
jgi:hypothetical protein